MATIKGRTKKVGAVGQMGKANEIIDESVWATHKAVPCMLCGHLVEKKESGAVLVVDLDDCPSCCHEYGPAVICTECLITIEGYPANISVTIED